MNIPNAGFRSSLVLTFLVPILYTSISASDLDTSIIYRVPKAQILAAMHLEKGYDISQTPNGTRFQANVLRSCIAWALQQPQAIDKLLFMDHDDYFTSYLEVSGLVAEKAPNFARKSHAYKQDLLIEHRQPQVISEIREGPEPYLALNVKYWWPDTLGSPSHYSYHDTLSTPHLRVTHQQRVTYRLLYFDNMILHDEIQGISGRATSGLLGLLFKLMGDGKATQARMTLSEDHIQVVHAKARKGPFKKNQTVIVHPDGTGEKKIPRERSDLRALADQIEMPLDIIYVPLGF